ncbi:type II toxin-antitoxin system RelE/ParE family toxin [Maribacter sp. PR1]|uniref:Type II toxin-antitoxin system RelE/ParE family toxin n=1 Tax=Maribacter cobaltidurans TaxID=1178778 RepID=A0ABU7IY52_9FLAO|nr:MULTISPECIES: type II toxin-antitoxin system RelE/ParE family toxin [Maribacter]MDC6390529.1 type II toxin-antitoxin system RelE/ParE family toxin [Maribacter sp. PR1]MEE1977919.1 type II toxin-antitoxin system RelE/ParE family toxin [Maribacter cobaltidurans]
MDNHYKVIWTRRSLTNALAIKSYLNKKFSKKEVVNFERLLRQFELTVSNFPTLYPESNKQKSLRRAVIHKNTTVFYIFDKNQVTVIAMKDNRQEKASK